MKRLCFLSPDIDHAKRVVAHLKGDAIEEKHIYVLGRADLPLDALPDGGPEDNDFFAAFERGVALGGAGGMFAGLFAVAFPPAGIVVGGGAVLLIGLAGASLGGLLTGMAGAAFPSSRLSAFETDIHAGKVLILVDVPQKRIDQVNELIAREEPAVEIDGIEPPAPIIPH